jgi:hypothetical protein
MAIPDIGTSMVLLIMAGLLVVLSISFIGNVGYNKWLALIPALLISACATYGIAYPMLVGILAGDITMSIKSQQIWAYVFSGIVFLCIVVFAWRIITNEVELEK